MRKYHRKYTNRTFFHSTFVIILLIFIVIFVSYKFIIEFQKYLFVRKEYKFSITQSQDSLNKQNANQVKLDEINTQDGEETYIREAYPVKKEGEGLIVLYDNKDSTYDIPKAPNKWQAFLNYLKSIFHRD